MIKLISIIFRLQTRTANCKAKSKAKSKNERNRSDELHQPLPQQLQQLQYPSQDLCLLHHSNWGYLQRLGWKRAIQPFQSRMELFGVGDVLRRWRI